VILIVIGDTLFLLLQGMFAGCLTSVNRLARQSLPIDTLLSGWQRGTSMNGASIRKFHR
jgi:hypothetical protein